MPMPQKPMKFVFRIGIHRSEVPAAIVARNVAKELRARGHAVRFIRTPKALTNEGIAKSNPDASAIPGLFEKRVKYAHNLRRLGSADEHVIDWHNSAPEAFFTTENRALHEYPVSFMKAGGPHDSGLLNPATLLLPEDHKGGRLIGTMEVPAIAASRRATSGEKFMLKKMSKLKPESRLKAMDGAIDFGKNYKQTFLSRESIKAGFTSAGFSARIAGDLETAAADRKAMPVTTKGAETEAAVALAIRSSPVLSAPGVKKELARELETAERNAREFDARYAIEAPRLMREQGFEKARPQLAKLNKEKERLGSIAVGLQGKLDSLEKLEQKCRELGTTPQQVIAKYGMKPHFAR